MPESDQHPPFPPPPHLAAIDAGSNAIRVVVAQHDAADTLTVLEADRLPVRLGHRAFTHGRLDAPTMDAAVDAFARFRKLFDDHDVTRYRAVATSAMRSASNRELLQHRLFHETGIELEVISGYEEARLVRRAVTRAFEGQELPRALLDLGGGSLEIGLRTGRRWRSDSLPIGTVRLMETFGIRGAIATDEARMVRRFVHSLVHGHRDGLGALDHDGWGAATGGNPVALARLFGRPHAHSGMLRLDLDALEEALPSVLEKSIEERMEAYAVREDRAEVMAIAGLLLATAMDELALRTVVVPGVGIREGLLLELADATSHEGLVPPTPPRKALRWAARRFARRVGHDYTHGEQVRELSCALFDQLSMVHGLARDDRLPLELAAILHDVGEVIDRRSHHKHSEYMVLNGRISGLESPLREVVAATVRAHRGSTPSAAKHHTFASLSASDQDRVVRLAALLRLADSLDTQHRQRIRDVRAFVEDGVVVLRLEVSAPGIPAPPLRKAALFEEVFGHPTETVMVVVPQVESSAA